MPATFSTFDADQVRRYQTKLQPQRHRIRRQTYFHEKRVRFTLAWGQAKIPTFDEESAQSLRDTWLYQVPEGLLFGTDYLAP